jgi:hypothetical protein
MTCHIALANTETVVLSSDSQSSDDRSEVHGLQKQFAGRDFLVGVAGLSIVIPELFDRLEAASRSGGGVVPLDAANLPAFLAHFIDAEIRPEARREIEIIIVTPPDAKGNAVQTFLPGTFARLGRREPIGMIGSGAEFAFRAFSRYAQLGIELPFASLADLVLTIYDLAKAADESLTVDDSFLLGIITNGKSYLMGDQRISMGHADGPILREWPQAAIRFHAIMSSARTINSEMVDIQRKLSAIRTGNLSQLNLDAIQYSNARVIATERRTLVRLLDDYLAWYDGILGRS